jgi:hypothetical protein
MKTHPKTKEKNTVNRAQLAKLMGVSLPTIDDWQRRGCPVAETGGKGRSYGFNVQEVIEWRVKDERRRQGLSAAAVVNASEKPVYNPLRALAHDAAVSYGQYVFCKPIVEDMIRTVREKTGCDERAAKMTVASMFTIHWIVLSTWVIEDRFSKELEQRGDLNFDDQVLRMNSRAQFIPGPLPTDKLEDGSYTPKAIEDLFEELTGNKLSSEDDAEENNSPRV